MKKTALKLAIAGLILATTSISANASLFSKPTEADIVKAKKNINTENNKILKKLFKAEPKSKELLDKSYGYATFSNFGMKIFLAGGGTGKGIVFPKNGKPIYMDMAEIQAGLGFGIKQFEVVFIFETKEALDSFVNQGWEFGGQATAAAKYGSNGGAYQGATSVSEGVWMYQLTKNGLAADITVKGTKYYKDSELN